MTIDADARVYLTGQEDLGPAPCMLFLKCRNEANAVYDAGVLGNLPGCKRCIEKLESL